MTSAEFMASLRLIRDDIWTTKHVYLQPAEDSFPGLLKEQEFLAETEDYRRVAEALLEFEDWATVTSARRIILSRNSIFAPELIEKAVKILDQARHLLIELEPELKQYQR